MNNVINFFEKTTNRKVIKYVLAAFLVLLLIADLFVEKHEYFSWAEITGFYPVVGFVVCTVVIAVSIMLGKWLQKEEDYYD